MTAVISSMPYAASTTRKLSKKAIKEAAEITQPFWSRPNYNRQLYVLNIETATFHIHSSPTCHYREKSSQGCTC